MLSNISVKDEKIILDENQKIMIGNVIAKNIK